MGFLTNIINAKKIFDQLRKPRDEAANIRAKYAQPSLVTETIRGLPEATKTVGKYLISKTEPIRKDIGAFVTGPATSFLQPPERKQQDIERRKEFYVTRYKQLEKAGANIRKANEILYDKIVQRKQKYSQLTTKEKESLTGQAVFALSFVGGLSDVSKILAARARLGPTIKPGQPQTGLRELYGKKPMSRGNFESSFVFGDIYSEMPKNKLYQPNGNLQPSIAIGRVNDAAQKLNISFPDKGLGEAFKKSVNIKKIPGLDWLRNKGMTFWKMGEQGKSVIPQTKFFRGEQAVPVFKGFKDLTTQFLNYAKGKTTLSRQEIMDFAKRPELKKGEADLLLKKLEEFEYKKPQLEFFRLTKGKEAVSPAEKKRAFQSMPDREGYEKVFMPYGEQGKGFYYQPLKDSIVSSSKLPAQEFADSIRRDLLELKPVKVKEPQYTRITIGETTPSEYNLLGKNAGKNYEEVVFESPITTNGSSHYPNSKNYFAHARGDEVIESGNKIWREQEIQSDLLQKENLERAFDDFSLMEGNENRNLLETRLGHQGLADARKARGIEKEKLQPFTNDRFGERIMRERIKEKASKGYEKYRLPTGETIGKIEGFVSARWRMFDESVTGRRGVNPYRPVETNDLKAGIQVFDGQSDWIITDILGDGRFKAVQKSQVHPKPTDFGTAIKAEDTLPITVDGNKMFYRADHPETFDLTGKSNPQYRRYENWGKFLKNKYGGKEVTDPQGNKWVEIDLKPEYGKQPVVAFKKGGQEPKYLASEKSGEKLLRKMLSPDEAKFLVWDTLPKEFGDAYGATEFLWNSIKKKYDVIINVLKKDGKVSQDVIVHEIMHPYVELFLNAKEKARVFNEVLRHHGKDKVAKVMKIYGDDKGLVAEELLANDWQEFLRTGKTYSSVIKGFFNRLWDFLQRLIGRRGNVEKLFNDILARKRPSRVISTEGRLEKTRFKLGEKRGLPEIKQELAVLNDVIKNHPAFPLTKFANKSGELPEVIGRGGKFGKEGDTLVTELGFSDSEAARQAYEDLQQLRNRRKELRQSIISSADETKATPPVEKPLTEAVSVEKQAKQALRRVAEPMRDKVYSLPEIIKQTSTDVKQKVNIFDYIRTPEKVLQKIGFEEEAKLIRQGYEAYLKELPVNLDKITQWFKEVPKESNERIFRYLDGKDVDLTVIEKKVAGEISDWLAEWADRLKLPADKRISHYITHIFDEQLIAKEFDEDLAKIITDKIPGEIYDPFLLRRLGAKGYKQDTWAALDAYAKRATRKANMDNALESLKFKTGGSLESSKLEISQFKYIQRYVSHINLRPTEIDNLIDNAIKSVFGYRLGQRPVARITKFLRQMTYRGMLGLNISSSLRNISQGINTYAVLGEKYTAIGYANLLKRGAYKELEEQGVLHSGFIQDRQLHAVKKALEKTDKVLFAFFDTAEKINRGSAYFGAKVKAIKEGKNIDEAIQYAKKIVRRTQFAFGSIDTPVAMQSDIAKTLVQFQTYTVKQIEFLTEMAKDKNFVGLLRYALAGTLFIFTIGRAFGMKPEELIPDFRFGIPPSLKFPIETTKAVLDVPDKYGRKRDIKRKVSDVGKSLVGLIPGGTQARKTLEGLRAIKERGVYNRAGKLQYEQGQSTLKKIQALLFGKYASKEAQEYFEKKETGKSKNAGSDILKKYNIPTTNQSAADDILKKYNIPIK